MNSVMEARYLISPSVRAFPILIWNYLSTSISPGTTLGIVRNGGTIPSDVASGSLHTAIRCPTKSERQSGLRKGWIHNGTLLTTATSRSKLS